MKNIRGILLMIFILFADLKQLYAQCTPVGTDLCDDAFLFCSLDELNGYTCRNPEDPNTIGPNPICPGDINPHNIIWWAFIADGGLACVTMRYTNCASRDSGLQYGIYSDCTFVDLVACDNACGNLPGVKTICADLTACKIYYLFIDGCWGDVCDFTLTTTGGGPPNLSPLGFINRIPSGIIQPVCKGACNYKLSVDIQPGGCPPTHYSWTLDGNEIGGYTNEIMLDFPDEGDFLVCVKAVIGNPFNGSICAEEQRCAIVKVRPISDKLGIKRTLCYEVVNPDGYLWHSQLIFNSGIYREHLTDVNCCEFDSIVEFIVLPFPKVPQVNYISCDGKPFVDALGRPWPLCCTELLIELPGMTKPFECDSSITLTAINVDITSNWVFRCANGKVEISPNVSILDPCEAGESYEFEYNWFRKNDVPKRTISKAERLLVNPVNEDYCLDVIVKIKLGTDSVYCSKTFCDTVNEVDFFQDTNSILLFSCDSFTINGKTYNQSTQFTHHFKNKFGCDSTIITDLQISQSNVTEIKQSACDSLIINNKVYTESGIYDYVLSNMNGCDSLIKLQLEIGKSSNSDLHISSCDSVIINNTVYAESGVYMQFLTNAMGCDSTINLDLQIERGSFEDFYLNACDTVLFQGQAYTKSGDYKTIYKNIKGCDSILNLHINITNSNVFPLMVRACDSAVINGIKYSQSGNYIQKLKNTNDCDSTLNIELVIAKSNHADHNVTSCDSVIVNGQKYVSSGNYTQVLQNSEDCDSTLFIKLNLLESTTANFKLASCDSVMINGQKFEQTGTYIQRLKNANQCDSILNIEFTRLKFSTADLDITACDSILVNGQTYKISGDYLQQLKNSTKCDSILKIKLNIFKSNFSNLTLHSCDSAILNGQVFRQSGNYIQNLKNVNQCDSILNVQYTHLNASSYILSQSSCDSIVINGITYFASGKYKQVLNNHNGCDSTLILDLTIRSANLLTLDAGKDTSVCEGELLKLNATFNGSNDTVGITTKFYWQSARGNFDYPDRLTTNFYSYTIGNQRIYLRAEDDCKKWFDSLELQILPNQFVQVTGDTIIDPCKEKEIRFTATGGTNYIWTPSSNIECLDPPCSQIKLRSTVATRFTITTDGPCTFPTNLNLSFKQSESDVYLPNAFSPNGDNINDIFLPVFHCEQITFYHLQIFDRWGNLIFESTNKDKGWNGKQEEVHMIPGVYPYVIEYELHNSERKVKAGDVTLIK